LVGQRGDQRLGEVVLAELGEDVGQVDHDALAAPAVAELDEGRVGQVGQLLGGEAGLHLGVELGVLDEVDLDADAALLLELVVHGRRLGRGGVVGGKEAPVLRRRAGGGLGGRGRGGRVPGRRFVGRFLGGLLGGLLGRLGSGGGGFCGRRRGPAAGGQQ